MTTRSIEKPKFDICIKEKNLSYFCQLLVLSHSILNSQPALQYIRVGIYANKIITINEITSHIFAHMTR